MNVLSQPDFQKGAGCDKTNPLSLWRNQVIKTECDFTQIAQTIIDHLKAETPPWEESYLPLSEPPKNFGTGHPYVSLNQMQIALGRFLSPWYLTAKQIEIYGGKIKADQAGGIRLFRYGVHREEPDYENENDPLANHLVRRYTVFNSCQVSGIDFPEVNSPAPQNKGQILRNAQSIIDRMPNPPEISEGR